jgi:predicted nucleic acid-binding protein
MIVVDANTIAYVWFPSAHQEAIFGLIHTDQNWVVPFLWKSEFQNIMAAYLRRKYYTFSQATEIMLKAESLLAGNEQPVKSVSVLGLVNQSTCSAYDCEYVALAKELNVKLITYDKKILREFPETAMKAEDYILQFEQ